MELFIKTYGHGDEKVNNSMIDRWTSPVFDLV